MNSLRRQHPVGRIACDVERRLSDLGEVDEVTILPLVERLTAGEQLHGEAGLSYLVRAGAGCGAALTNRASTARSSPRSSTH